MPTLRLRAMRKADLSWVAQAERQLFRPRLGVLSCWPVNWTRWKSLDDRIYVVAEVDARYGWLRRGVAGR